MILSFIFFLLQVRSDELVVRKILYSPPKNVSLNPLSQTLTLKDLKKTVFELNSSPDFIKWYYSHFYYGIDELLMAHQMVSSGSVSIYGWQEKQIFKSFVALNENDPGLDLKDRKNFLNNIKMINSHLIKKKVNQIRHDNKFAGKYIPKSYFRSVLLPGEGTSLSTSKSNPYLTFDRDKTFYLTTAIFTPLYCRRNLRQLTSFCLQMEKRLPKNKILKPKSDAEKLLMEKWVEAHLLMEHGVLVERLKAAKYVYQVVDAVGVFYYNLLSIHPFREENARTIRLVMMQLLQGYNIPAPIQLPFGEEEIFDIKDFLQLFGDAVALSYKFHQDLIELSREKIPFQFASIPFLPPGYQDERIIPVEFISWLYKGSKESDGPGNRSSFQQEYFKNTYNNFLEFKRTGGSSAMKDLMAKMGLDIKWTEEKEDLQEQPQDLAGELSRRNEQILKELEHECYQTAKKGTCFKSLSDFRNAVDAVKPWLRNARPIMEQLFRLKNLGHHRYQKLENAFPVDLKNDDFSKAKEIYQLTKLAKPLTKDLILFRWGKKSKFDDGFFSMLKKPRGYDAFQIPGIEEHRLAGIALYSAKSPLESLVFGDKKEPDLKVIRLKKGTPFIDCEDYESLKYKLFPKLESIIAAEAVLNMAICYNEQGWIVLKVKGDSFEIKDPIKDGLEPDEIKKIEEGVRGRISGFNHKFLKLLRKNDPGIYKEPIWPLDIYLLEIMERFPHGHDKIVNGFFYNFSDLESNYYLKDSIKNFILDMQEFNPKIIPYTKSELRVLKYIAEALIKDIELLHNVYSAKKLTELDLTTFKALVINFERKVNKIRSKLTGK